MKIHKFEGATMRDAIAKVKAELGDQAVIISTRQIRRGLLGTALEISAAVEDRDDYTGSPQSGPSSGGPNARQDVDRLIDPLRSEMRSLRAMVRASGESRGTAELRSEVLVLRKLIEDLGRAQPHQDAPMSPRDEPVNEPAQRAATRTLEPAAREPLHRQSLARSYGRTNEQLDNDQPENDQLLTRASTARTIMLVGPTGAGKTTTIAKLAARAALIDGKRVKLITLDNYRVGGIDQIRTFAELIGIPLDVAESAASLAGLLDEAYDLTLIDTAGRSPRDIGSISELAAELPDLPPIEVHLVVPAASSPAAIDELATRYRRLAPARLLFTKLDEVELAPELINAPSRTRIPITWVTTGQDVPEDIEEPTATRVLELANGVLALASGGLAGRITRTRSHRAA